MRHIFFLDLGEVAEPSHPAPDAEIRWTPQWAPAGLGAAGSAEGREAPSAWIPAPGQAMDGSSAAPTRVRARAPAPASEIRKQAASMARSRTVSVRAGRLCPGCIETITGGCPCGSDPPAIVAKLEPVEHRAIPGKAGPIALEPPSVGLRPLERRA